MQCVSICSAVEVASRCQRGRDSMLVRRDSNLAHPGVLRKWPSRDDASEKSGPANIEACRDPSFSIPLPTTHNPQPNINARQAILLSAYQAQVQFHDEGIGGPVFGFFSQAIDMELARRDVRVPTRVELSNDLWLTVLDYVSTCLLWLG
jgi:hypothetical protein